MILASFQAKPIDKCAAGDDEALPQKLGAANTRQCHCLRRMLTDGGVQVATASVAATHPILTVPTAGGAAGGLVR